MLRYSTVILALVWILHFPLVGSAQQVQVPMDEEGGIDFINAELEKQLGLFDDSKYPNFHEARLFQVSDTSYLLEISYQSGGSMLRDSRSLSVEEVSELRRTVTERVRRESPQSLLDQSGRTKLLTGTLALSLGYYGWSVPVAFDVEDDQLAVALYMLTSGVGFYAPLRMTSRRDVTNADANLALYGGTRGIVSGLSLAGMIKEHPSGQLLAASGMVASVAESVGGYYLARASGMSAGTAETIGIGGDFGIGIGLGVAHLAGFFDKDQDQAVWGSILAGSGLGLLSGKMLSASQPYTLGDAYILRTAGLLGAYLPLVAVDGSDTDNEKVFTASSMAGALIGLGLGSYLVQGKDFTTAQGRLVTLNSLAGGLVGLGLAYLVTSEPDDNSVVYLGASSLGAMLGFGLSYSGYAPRASAADETAWQFDIRPEGLLALATGKQLSLVGDAPPPLFTLGLRF